MEVTDVRLAEECENYDLGTGWLQKIKNRH